MVKAQTLHKQASLIRRQRPSSTGIRLSVMGEKQKDRQRKTKWKSCGNETNRRAGSLSVCFTLLNPSRLLASRFTAHLGVCFSTRLPQCSFLSLSDRNKDGKMNRRWQRRRSKGWTAFSCFSGDKWRIFALESRHKDDKGSSLKQILLSSTQICCPALSGVFELLSRCFPYWLTNQGSFITDMKKVCCTLFRSW